MITANNIKALEKVWTQAARWVREDYRQTASVDTVILKPRWPTLEQWRKKAGFNTFFKFYHRLIHIESKHNVSPTGHSRSSTQHAHGHTCDMPSHWIAYRQKTFFPRTLATRVE